MAAYPDVRQRVYGLMVVGIIRLSSPSLAMSETTIFEKPLSPRIANYDIKVTLDDKEKRINGEMVLTWNNPSEDYVDELQFHLYTNAFKNSGSTFVCELIHSAAAASGNGEPDEAPWTEDEGWGWISITHMAVNGDEVTGRIAFFQPDDGNTDDETVIRVPLPKPLAPRTSARIDIEFDAKIPQCHVRTGWWQDDFFMMAHWFPKIGVYETPGMRFVPADAPHGRWNCHQFHAATEFYADYGVYDVQITLPEKYIVGVTGLVLEERSNGDGTKTVVAHAEDVHEFAWVADAQFREATAVWHSTATDQEVNIRLLYQPGHGCVVAKYLESVIKTLDHVEGWLGPRAYPYPNITIVDPRKGSRAGGMEYPTLITGGASWWMEQLFGNGLRRVESVTVHEFMHQIWYGIVGSNEFEEAWLDEGLTTYSTGRILGELFGEKTTMLNWWGASAGQDALRRRGYAAARSRNDGSIAEPTFAHWNTRVGRNMAYNKTSLMLKTLENYLGRERFDRIMRTYFQRWRFRHPGRYDFTTVANEVAGENLDWFFSQLLEEHTSLDYAVASIANVPVDAFEEGILGDNLTEPQPSGSGQDDPTKPRPSGSGQGKQADDHEAKDKAHQSTVVFRRIGEIIFPVETLIEFSDGEVVRAEWDGRDRVKTYRFTRSAKVVRAAIDPDNRVPLDVDRLNNSLRIQENRQVTDKYTLKGFFWMQSLLQLFSLFG